MKALSGTDLIQDPQYFWTDSGCLSSNIYTDLNKCMIWVAAHKWLLVNISYILSSPKGPSNSKCPIEMSTEKYPVNELLLTHRDTNTQRVLILHHFLLLPNDQHIYHKSIPSTYHPTQTCLGRKKGHTILV